MAGAGGGGLEERLLEGAARWGLDGGLKGVEGAGWSWRG